jgi:hypothetical protein
VIRLPILLLAVLLGACAWWRPDPPPTPAPAAPHPPAAPAPADAPPDTAPLADRLAYWERRAIVLQGSYEGAKTAAKTLRQEASLAPLDRKSVV